MKKLRTWAYDHAYQAMVVLAICVLTTTFSSCEKENIEPEDINNLTTQQVDSLKNLYGGWWYIDTVYNESNQNLMELENQNTRRVQFNIDSGDTTWVESSTTINFFDRYDYYGAVGDTLYWKPEIQSEPWRAMLIDSLTTVRLHFRVVNSSPEAKTSDFTHASLLYYEYTR